MQLILRRRLLQLGYTVGQIGTEHHSALFGMDLTFPMGYASNVLLPLQHYVPYLDYKLRQLSHQKRPDLILVGSQSGTIPYDVHEHCTHSLTCTAFLLGTKPDACILNIKAGNTPLHWAAAKNMAETVKVLLAWGTNVNEKNNKGATPLQWEAGNNAAETAQLLLTQGAEVNAKADRDWTPLHYAARENAYKPAQLLLTQGAEVNAKSDKGRTPLHCAAEMDAAATAELLLKQGADVNAKSDDGLTLLSYATEHNAAATAELLNRYGGRASPHGGDLPRLTP